MELTWDQVPARRMRRQHLDPVDGGSALEITRRLCGIQAQVRNSAAQAIAGSQRSWRTAVRRRSASTSAPDGARC